MSKFDKQKITELYPGAENLMIEPMLIHKGTDAQLKKASDSGEYFAQLKKDGCTDEKILNELREERDKILKDLNL